MKQAIGWILVLGVLAGGAVYWVFHDQAPIAMAAMPTPAALPVSTPAVVVAKQVEAPAWPVIAPIKTKTDLYAAFDAIELSARQKTPESLALLVAYASMPNPDVSSPALDALIRRGDVAAGPMLRAAAKTLEDPRAAVVLLDTADFIELPPADFSRVNKPKAPSPVSLRRRPPPPESATETPAAEPATSPVESTTPVSTTN